MIKRRIICAVIGLLFGIGTGFWAMLVSGGGHFNLPMMLIVSPLWLGLLFWPIWGFMAVRFDSIGSRCLFVLMMIAHFAGVFLYVLKDWEDDRYWFSRVSPEDYVFPASVAFLYLGAQLLLWFRFLSDVVIRPVVCSSRRVSSEGKII